MSDLLTQFGQQPQTLLTNIGSGIAQLGGGLIDQAVNRKNQEAYSTAMGNWEQDQTTENYKALMNASRPLGIYDQTVADIEAMDAITQKNRLERNGKMLAAYESGDIPSILKFLTEERDALTAEGESAEVKGIQDTIDKIEAEGADSFAKNLKILTAMIPGGTDLLDNIKSLSEEEREEERFKTDQIMTTADIFKTMQDLEVTDIEERIRLGEVMEGMPLSYGKELSNLISIAGGVDPKKMTPDQFSKLTTTLRTEYFDDTAGFRTNDVVNDKMSASLAQDSSQGDVGALFLFMKMLDENSVVRESEFRTASNMGGVLDSLQNTLDGWKTGQRLQPGQKENLKKLTEEFFKLSQEKRGLIDSRMKKNTEFFGVPDDLVFLDYDSAGTTPSIVETDIPTGGNTRLQTKRQEVYDANPQSKVREAILKMSDEELNTYAAGRLFDEKNPVEPKEVPKGFESEEES